MKRSLKLIALVLVAAMLLTGCSPVAFRQWVQGLLGQQLVSFAEMEYTRPDMEEFRTQLDVCIRGAKTDIRAKTLMDKVFTLYDLYYRFYTNYKLANIHYYKDLTDTYWADEYTYCLENTAEVDAGMDKLLYALAQSPLKEKLEAEEYFGADFFDAYTGQSLWDETFTELMAQEMKLQNEYDALSAQALEFPYYSEAFYDSVGLQMEQLLIELVALRQKIARQAGYDDYLQFAYDFYYDRDYTPAQAMAYMEDVRDELVVLYTNIPDDVWKPRYQTWTQEEMFSYVESSANAMGGIIADAFYLLEEGGYYDISYSPNKYNASFETYLQYYYVPFIFVNPQGDSTDPLIFAHEFGHFCNDYAATGTVCGIDVSEVFSQGMEYLSLFYGENGEVLKKMKLAGSLSTFVEQSAYANFEHQLYLLEEPTVENVRALYAKNAEDYGFEAWRFDSREYVTISHLYIAPMYMVSYVLSNDLAMQIYQAEEAQAGSGKALLADNLATEEVSLTAFVKSAGFADPFAEGRVAQLRKTFEKVLG
ncbi:MAG: hypothetical protein IJZ15_07510 [Oscillospiraceae bacterium]|nr:hypothetical protein [Oscillospiraceae bacterium]